MSLLGKGFGAQQKHRDKGGQFKLMTEVLQVIYFYQA